MLKASRNLPRKSFRIVCIFTSLLFVLAQESCITLYTGRYTIIDMGGALAEPGQQRARLRKNPPATPDGKAEFHHRIWKQGDDFIVEVPLAFVPVHYPIIQHNAGHRPARQSLHYRFYGHEDEEIIQYPRELCYTQLTAKQLQVLVRTRKGDVISPPRELRQARLIRAEQINFTTATLVYDSQIHKSLSSAIPELDNGEAEKKVSLWKLDINKIPPHRTWYNRCLQPLSWCAEVIDIPLSMLATPIGWLADAIYEPLNN